MRKTCIIAVDAGGTNIKSCLILEGGNVAEGTLYETSSNSGESADKIIEAQTLSIQRQLSAVKRIGLDLGGIAEAFPGPFDYSTGTCLMKHKYKAVYKKPLLPEMKKLLDLPENCRVEFFHDLHAFTYGEYLYGSGKGCGSLLGVSIGTGLGTGLVTDDRIVDNGKKGPAYPIFQKPYKNGVLEDLVSARGIVNHFSRLKGKVSSDDLNPLKIARMAFEERDPEAIETFGEMGRVLGQYLKPLIDSLKVKCLVLGGQISRSYELFGPQMKKELEQCDSLSGINASRDLDYISFKGAAALLEKG